MVLKQMCQKTPRRCYLDKEGKPVLFKGKEAEYVMLAALGQRHEVAETVHVDGLPFQHLGRQSKDTETAAAFTAGYPREELAVPPGMSDLHTQPSPNCGCLVSPATKHTLTPPFHSSWACRVWWPGTWTSLFQHRITLPPKLAYLVRPAHLVWNTYLHVPAPGHLGEVLLLLQRLVYLVVGHAEAPQPGLDGVVGLGKHHELGHVGHTDDFSVHLGGKGDRFLGLSTVYQPEPRKQFQVSHLKPICSSRKHLLPQWDQSRR